MVGSGNVGELSENERINYDPSQVSSFSPQQNLEAVALRRSYPTGKIGSWLIRQDA